MKTIKRRFTCMAFCCLLFTPAFSVMGSAMSIADQPHSKIQFAKTQLLFEENQGQFSPDFDYLARGKGYTIALGLKPVIEMYRFGKEKVQTDGVPEETPQYRTLIEEEAQIRLSIIGAREAFAITPMQKRKALTHYLMGEPSNWKTDIPNYERVRYEAVLPGVDVEYYGMDGRLEYDFVVQPGGNPDAIGFTFEGADDLRISEKGELIIELGDQQIVQRAPVSYQLNANGERLAISSSYTLEKGVVGFELAQWDRSRTLVIDPVLEYSRYYGGPGNDTVAAAGLDSTGNIYVIGNSVGSGLATPGAYQETNDGDRVELESYPTCFECTDLGEGDIQVRRVHIARTNSSVMVTKFSPSGEDVLYTTYFNSTPQQELFLGVNSAGVSDTGEVAFGVSFFGGDETGLPLVNHTQTASEIENNAYVAKLNSAGNGLIFGTYLNLGDYFNYWVRGLDVSPSGEVAVSGMVSRNNTFPEINSIAGQSCTLNDKENENSEGFVALFDTTGDLTFSTCIGGEMRDGSSREGLRGIAIGDDGDLYVTGYSAMTDYPLVNPIQSTKLAGAQVVTISHIDPDTSTILFSTYFGPSSYAAAPYDEFGGFGFNFPYDIKVDSGGNIVVAGTVGFLDWPIVNGLQVNMAVPRSTADFSPRIFGDTVSDLFIAKVHPVNGIVFSTFLGGSKSEGGAPALALDSQDGIYILSMVISDDYPLLNEIQSEFTEEASLGLSKITPSGGLAFSTFLGTRSADFDGNSVGLAVNAANRIIVAGSTESGSFPTIGSASSNSGKLDITLSIIDQSGDTDTDGDGVPDAVDAFINDDTEWLDTDSDGTGDNADTDDDEDGTADLVDRFPLDDTEQVDADDDGAGDNLDEFDADAANYFDLDDDGMADFGDADADGDGVDNQDDAFYLDPTETTDFDGDGTGDVADLDDDGDGESDLTDPAPFDPFIPIFNFETYNAHDVSRFLSPWPPGFIGLEGADKAWTSAEDQAHDSEVSFGTEIIDHDQVAVIQHIDDYPRKIVSFWYKVDSQENFDILTFSIDSEILLTVSGDSGWQFFTTELSAGVHTLEWRYAKDGSVSVGDDAAWIDDFRLLDQVISQSSFE